MMKRRIPQPLHDTVRALASAIAPPSASNQTPVDVVVAKAAKAQLMELFHHHQETGTPDPFLTETVAAFTADPIEAARLYALALEQCTAFPGEPMHSKRCGLIEALWESGRSVRAREELVRARRAAFAAGDSRAVAEIDALARRMA